MKNISTRYSLPAAVSIAMLAAVGLNFSAGVPATADGPTGSCSFNLKNQWVGPLKACMTPSTAADCEATGKKDENSDAKFAESACPVDGLVGTCKTEKASLNYYDGEAANLEIGCGFQQGEWLTPAK